MAAAHRLVTPRRIVFLAYPGFQSLDVFGPLEAFALTNRGYPDSYDVQLVAPDGPLATSSGIGLAPTLGLDSATGPIDTLVVAGGAGARRAAADGVLVDWIREAAPRSRRVASVCTGAFLLAAGGLLDGRRATTHWHACAALQRAYPQIKVETDPIFVRDGNIYTSAGITAGIDLALGLIAEDLGSKAALETARSLVLFVRRPGGQSQFSATLAGQPAERDGIYDIQHWIAEHLDADLSVPALAARTCMSPRHFARVFARETGVTPAEYVSEVRTERARLLLETTDLQVDEIAAKCGFGTVETLRRTFGRTLHVNPRDYRARFAA